MNEFRPIPRQRQTTRAADGLPRLKWTIEEFDSLAQHGFLTEDDRIELIGGELVPMSPKGNRHELVRDELHDFLVRRLTEHVRLSSEIGWRPDSHTYLEPDIIVYPSGFVGISVPPREILFLIEVADSSLRFDLDRKAKIYAGLGVREYWVIDANSLDTTVHRAPQGENYSDIRVVGKNDVVTPVLLPALAVSLGALKFK